MPDVAVAGVEEHAVAGADRRDALALDHLLHVLGGDDARIAGAVLLRHGQLAAAQRDRIEQHAAAHEALLRHVLDAERPHARRAHAFVVQEAAIVVEHALGGDDADMAGAVELGADLADLGRHVLVVVDELLAVRTGRRSAGPG